MRRLGLHFATIGRRARPEGTIKGGALFVAALLAALVHLVAGAGDASAVTEGVVDPSRFPSVVLIRTVGKGVCSGVAVDPTHVVTAAHCVKGLRPGPGQRTEVQEYAEGRLAAPILVDRMAMHPNYADAHKGPYGVLRKVGFDIGVVHLKGPLSTRDFPRPLQAYIDKPLVDELGTTGATNWELVRIQLQHKLRRNDLGLPEAWIVGFACPKGHELCDGHFYVRDRKMRLGTVFPADICKFPRDTPDWGGDVWCGPPWADRGDSGGPVLFRDKAGRYVLAGVVSQGIGKPELATLNSSVLATQAFLASEGVDFGRFHAAE